MTKPQSIYASRSRKRGYHDAAAIQKSWTRMDILRAYITPDGDLVVIDMNDNLYTTVGEAVELYPPETAEPAEVPTGNGLPSGVDLSVVPQSIAARRALEQAGGEHSGTTESEVRTRLAKGASQFLAALKLLDTVHGPEWREKLTQMAS